jgi:hypothetical protein
MRLPEDGPKCGPKPVANIKYNLCEQFDLFIYIYCCVEGQIPSLMIHNRMQTAKTYN